MPVLPSNGDFPIYKLFRATRQIVPVPGVRMDDKLMLLIVDATMMSKNFGPFYSKAAFDATIRNKPGFMLLEFDEEDTDTPGFLNVQILSRTTFLQYWFSISSQTAQEAMDEQSSNG